jgi:hypothetical protein
MKNRMKTVMYLFIICSVYVVSCGDSSNEGSLTSVDSSKKAEDLSEKELQQMCEDYTETLASVVGQEFFCTVGGIAAAQGAGGIAMVCDFAYDACMDNEGEFDLDSFFSCEDFMGDQDEIKDCDATVGEVDTCVQDTLKLFEIIAGSISCADSSSEGLEEIFDLETPASCEALDDDCPGMDDIDGLDMPF